MGDTPPSFFPLPTLEGLSGAGKHWLAPEDICWWQFERLPGHQAMADLRG
jgi:hypothetical protein